MTIERLREALSAIGPPPDARELSEMLWLACHTSPPRQGGSPGPPTVPEEPADMPVPEAPPTPAPPRPSEPLTGLHPRPAAEAEPAGSASEVLVPTAPMLADPLGVQRALRPLKRRVPSRHRLELNEDATAARIADTRRWTPVLIPSPERWLSLSLVVDTGPTMRLWRPLARELAETLLRQGAFQDVHVSYLDGTGRIASAPAAPPQDPGTLLDASGRQAVLVLSDCSGPHWWNGRAGQAVRRWAQAGPTAIVQPLAERLWRRTAAPAAPGLAVLPRPGAPNTGLRFTPYDGAAGPGVPVPVLEIAPRWFGAWARLVSGSDPQPAAVTTLPSRPSGSEPVRREHELPIAERVRRFLTTASPAAAELAAHVAVSVPSLPVMRLIQHRILGGSGPGQLAEVLLSGLLRPADGVRYAFVPGAREALLDTLPRPEALHTRHVLEAVSAEIERRAGTSAETFRALLPADGGPVTLTADTDHFALLTPRTRSHIAPAPVPALVELDVLRLNGAGPGGTFDEAWSLPASAPRDPAIGSDPDGNVVTLDPLDVPAGIPHGLVVGEAGARQHAVRNIALALAASYSPRDLTFAFAGLGDHPLGEPFDLPHTRFSDAELLGHPGRLRRFIGYLSDELDARTAGRPADPPGLVVFADVSLTFPSSRPEAAEALLSLAQRGRALGVQLLIAAETAGKTVTWDRFLPLLGRRIAASRRTPAELQRVLGQANLPFPDDRTAYLLAGGGSPRRFALAPDPPEPARTEFAQRVTRRHLDTMLAGVLAAGSDRATEDEPVMEVLRQLLASETKSFPPGEQRARHVLLEGADRPQMVRAAKLYGRMLAKLGVLSHGNVREVPRLDSTGRIMDDLETSVRDLFAQSGGGVLLFHMSDVHRLPLVTEFDQELRAMVAEHGEDPVVVLCTGAELVPPFRQSDPFISRGFQQVRLSGRAPARTRRRPAPTPARRVRIGVATGTREPVFLDFEAARHLLISGPSASGKASLVRGLIEEIAAPGTGLRRRVYFLDQERPEIPSYPSYAESLGIRYADTAENFAPMVGEAITHADDRLRSGTGPEIFFFTANPQRLAEERALTPLLSILESPTEHGLHLVMCRRQTPAGDPPDRFATALFTCGAPLLLTGYAGGREADLWEVPGDMRGRLAPGQAVIAHGARHERITWLEP